MISYIKGVLVEKNPTSIVVETGGIGYAMEISLSSYDTVGEPGEDITVVTHLHVRDDKLMLYGFSTVRERSLFRLLITISGVGPKLAQGILSGLSWDDLASAIQTQDVARLTAAPGVGKKTAERIIVELKDKIGDMYDAGVSGQGIVPGGASREAVLALVSLGYAEHKAQTAVNELVRNDPSMNLEQIVKQALQRL